MTNLANDAADKAATKAAGYLVSMYIITEVDEQEQGERPRTVKEWATLQLSASKEEKQHWGGKKEQYGLKETLEDGSVVNM